MAKTDVIEVNEDDLMEPGVEKNSRSELRAGLELSAKEKGVTIEELVAVGAEVMACLPLQVWTTLRYNEERTQRHLTPAQQIVDVLCFKFSAPLPKWGRDNRGYLSRITLDETPKTIQAKLEGVEP
jgi:hypothetical protein